jgi:superfamily II DNA/RNA helicase
MRRQLQHVKVLVLDEADQLLDMGFRKSLDGIIKVLPQQRQTLLFSATIPDQVHSMSQIALKKDHVFIDTVGEEDEETHAKVHNCSNLSQYVHVFMSMRFLHYLQLLLLFKPVLTFLWFLGLVALFLPVCWYVVQ